MRLKRTKKRKIHFCPNPVPFLCQASFCIFKTVLAVSFKVAISYVFVRNSFAGKDWVHLILYLAPSAGQNSATVGWQPGGVFPVSAAATLTFTVYILLQAHMETFIRVLLICLIGFTHVDNFITCAGTSFLFTTVYFICVIFILLVCNLIFFQHPFMWTGICTCNHICMCEFIWMCVFVSTCVCVFTAADNNVSSPLWD